MENMMTPAAKKFPYGATFGVEAPANLEIEGFENVGNPYVAKIDQNYVFNRELLRDVLGFLRSPDGDALYLGGPTGCGKTSCPTQVLARLNWPSMSFACHRKMSFDDLVGCWTVVDGKTRFLHGPLTLCMKHGWVLFIDELDRGEPAELVGLHPILDGSPLVIPQNGGEIIQPHPKFRIIVTGNSLGAGDQSGLYQGVLQQDLAFMDRFLVLNVSYPDPAVEETILKKSISHLPQQTQDSLVPIISKMVVVGNEIRKLFTGTDDNGNANSAELTVTLSTRTLLRWLRLTIKFRGAPNAVEFALERALTNRAEPEQKLAINKIAQMTFGDLWRAKNAKA